MSLRIMLKIFTVLLVTSASLIYSAAAKPLIPQEQEGQITINNRILARMNDKTISVFDIVKKMDLFLSSYYPEAMNSPLSRFQFYKTNWRQMLERMIDDQLILADSEGKDLKISDGDIRKAIFERLGPNVMASLDRLAITYDEARKTIHEDMVVQKMLGAKVHSKAYQKVCPQQIKSAYTDYLKEQDIGEEWEYQVISMRCANIALSEQLAMHAYSLLSAAKSGPETLAAKIQEMRKEQDPEINVTVSKLLLASEKTISEAHRKGLEGLQPGMYSRPISQTSGNDKTSVQRIFFLKNHGVKPAPTFTSVANSLRDNLLENAATEEERAYKSRLRQRYSYDRLHMEEIAADFQPFSFIPQS